MTRNRFFPRLHWSLTALFLIAGAWAADVRAEALRLSLRYQVESSPGSGRFHTLSRNETWKPEETAIIVCDVWDLHHSQNAVRRVGEIAPIIDRVLKASRQAGVTIIHAPSDCMDAYTDHPARRRAEDVPEAANLPPEIKTWCSRIPSEERGTYPIDQSDGGDDDDPQEHAVWAKHLESLGRNPALPWKAQTDLIWIDTEKDYISDRGDEVWSILQANGIKNVILTGVHTNMCVLGRPFGLRQMARYGKNVVLMRDLTDTMYNPRQWPYVSHFTGTDLIVSHIERFVCPTITSNQILGGKPYRFKNDDRPHVAIVIAEDEYRTNETLPPFAVNQLGKDFRVTLIHGSDTERNSIPGLSAIKDADVLLVSIRRRVLPTADMQLVRDFVESGKPVIGIRTASHAFALRNAEPPEGFADWPEFDAQVFGGNYHGHHGNQLKSTVQVVESAVDHPLLTGVTKERFPQGWSLYETSPLADGTTLLMTGEVEGYPAEPVAWTFTRADGGRSFYTSLGHITDFEREPFIRLLTNAVYWAAERPIPTWDDDNSQNVSHWSNVTVPVASDAEVEASDDATTWYRCVVRVPRAWEKRPVSLHLPGVGPNVRAWWNGEPVVATGTSDQYAIPSASTNWEDANLLVVSLEGGTLAAPPLVLAGTEGLPLRGRWQQRVGRDEAWAAMPLPAKFGATTDVVFMAGPPRFVATPLTKPHEFTGGIEGPACDAEGNIYVVNFARKGTIGRVRPDGATELFVTLPEGSTGNGIRFNMAGHFFVADYTGHNVLEVDPQTREISVLAHEDQMNQPNDLAIAPDGTLYASDPNWGAGTGQIWRIDPDGTVTRLASDMGTTNGIEVSPDGETLYVNESVQRNVWAFTLTRERTLKDKRLVRQFPDFGFDGMRCDVDGNLYITRHGKGTVVKLSPEGEILQEIDVLGSKPSNICFGGPDRMTAYVTEMEYGRVVQFRVDRPGIAWARWKR